MHAAAVVDHDVAYGTTCKIQL